MPVLAGPFGSQRRDQPVTKPLQFGVPRQQGCVLGVLRRCETQSLLEGLQQRPDVGERGTERGLVRDVLVLVRLARGLAGK